MVKKTVFSEYILEQLKLHPSSGPQDIIKQCYQAAHGAEHLLSNLDAAKSYLEKEYANTEAQDIPLYEEISHHVVRVNLAAWKYQKLPLDWLFRMFVDSAQVYHGGEALLKEYLEIADKVVKENSSIPLTQWTEFLSTYKENGMPPMHHSQNYRDHEHPAYRIINSQYTRLLPILQKAAGYFEQRTVCIIAIDGRAASGKSTMAKQLEMVLGGDIIQMDDFFLPPELRTEERFQMSGGNIHYERFQEEVLPYIKKAEGFEYRKFSCHKMDYDGICKVQSKNFRIVEGSYSCHPAFENYADIKVYLDVEPKEQMNRIIKRNGPDMAKMFEKRWIPLEEAYFTEYKIASKADVCV